MKTDQIPAGFGEEGALVILWAVILRRGSMLENICLVEFQKSAVEHLYAKVYSFFSSAVVMVAKGP